MAPSPPANKRGVPQADGAETGNALTVAQHMKTMIKVPMTPPIPTSQVILRKRITPKMFWMQGR